MFYSATMSIDPNQITEIKIIQPSKVFGKMLHFLTQGASSEKEEHETFTALSILQQFNMVFRSLNLNNIVRLSKDNIDFYLDTEGKEDDLKEAIEKFEWEVDHIESELFNVLFIVLEHEDSELKYLIEVDVKRKHKVKEYPINIKINGICKDFKGNDAQEVQNKMEDVFQSQDNYDSFLLKKQTVFDNFVSDLEQNLRKFIRIDDLHLDIKQKMIRPKEPIKDQNTISNYNQNRNAYQYEPVYHGYYGFGDMFFYTMLWSSLAYSHNIHVNNFTMVDETGANLMNVGDDGFNAGESDALNPDANFEMPSSMDSQDDFANIEAEEDSFSRFGSFGDYDSSDCSSCSDCGGD